LQVTILFTK